MFNKSLSYKLLSDVILYSFKPDIMGEMHILIFCNTALAFCGKRVGKFKTDYCVASFQTLVFDLI